MTTPHPATLATSTADRKPRRVLAIVVIGLVLGAHAWKTARLFPSVASIFDPTTPVVIVDHAIHEYHGALGARFLKANGTTWGYDPFFMAGYPETPVWDSSSNPSIAFWTLGGEANGFRSYKLGIFALSVLGFVTLILGGRAAGLGWNELAVATTLAGIYFWVEQPVSFLRTGLFAFVGAGLGSALLLGLCVRIDKTPDHWWAWSALALTGAGLFFTHVTAPILVGPGALAFYFTVARRHEWRWHLKVLGAVGFTVGLNLIWLVALWKFRGLRVGSGFFMTTDDPWFLWTYYLAPSVDSRTGLFLMIFGALGLVGWWFGGNRPAAAAFGGSIAFLIALTGFGSLWEPTKTLEPLRFRIVFCLLLAIPAGSALVLGPPWLARRLGGGRWARIGVASALVFAWLGWVRGEPLFFQSCANWLVYDRPLAVGYPPEARPLIDWLKRETDLSGRILFEDQLRLLEKTDAESTHWTPLLPALLGPDTRMFLGGLYQTAFIQHHEIAAFGDFQLGDRPIDTWTPAEIAAYADRYNVGWVVCWSPLSRFVFDRLTGVKRLATLPRHATFGRPPANNERERTAITRLAGLAAARRYIGEGESNYAVYRLDRPRSYFLRGRGRIVAVAPNRVEVADVEPDAEGIAVLSLHWLDTWKTDPPTTIRPEPALPDPVPFIRIETKRPIPRLVIENGY